MLQYLTGREKVETFLCCFLLLLIRRKNSIWSPSCIWIPAVPHPKCVTSTKSFPFVTIISSLAWREGAEDLILVGLVPGNGHQKNLMLNGSAQWKLFYSSNVLKGLLWWAGSSYSSNGLDFLHLKISPILICIKMIEKDETEGSPVGVEWTRPRRLTSRLVLVPWCGGHTNARIRSQAVRV